MGACKVCKGKIPYGRNNDYCSKKCQVAVEGYSERWTKKLALLEASTSWRPIPIEPVTHLVHANPIMIFSDVHAPLHSKDWIEKGLRIAQNQQSKILIVNGDFIDANSISRHLGGYWRRKSELNDDFNAGEKLIDLFSECFEQIVFLAGNHDLDRLMKAFNGEVAANRLWKMFGDNPKVKVSARSYVFVNDNIVVGHPRSYSRIRGNLAQKIAMNWQKHVVLGHAHHSATSATEDGKWQAVEVGCMADLPEFEYTTFEINNMPKPMNGFAMIRNSHIENFNIFTDWDRWL